jgi:hypothetical protein
MEPESTSEQALLRILELLKLQEYERQKNNRITDITTRSQLYSGLSVVVRLLAFVRTLFLLFTPAELLNRLSSLQPSRSLS